MVQPVTCPSEALPPEEFDYAFVDEDGDGCVTRPERSSQYNKIRNEVFSSVAEKLLNCKPFDLKDAFKFTDKEYQKVLKLFKIESAALFFNNMPFDNRRISGVINDLKILQDIVVENYQGGVWNGDIFSIDGYIFKVSPNSAAERAGIKPGDFLMSINGRPPPFLRFLSLRSLSCQKSITVVTYRPFYFFFFDILKTGLQVFFKIPEDVGYHTYILTPPL